MHLRITALALIGATLAACAGNPETGTGPRENTGTLVGSIAGAAVGSQFGGGTGERVAAGVAGAVIGGMIGNRIGAAMDDEDKQRAYAAQVQALESGPSGAPVAWRNPDSAATARSCRGRPTTAHGTKCRQYTHTIYIDGRPADRARRRLPRPDGTWNPVG